MLRLCSTPDGIGDDGTVYLVVQGAIDYRCSTPDGIGDDGTAG